jgi:hypothetical protein
MQLRLLSRSTWGLGYRVTRRESMHLAMASPNLSLPNSCYLAAVSESRIKIAKLSVCRLRRLQGQHWLPDDLPLSARSLAPSAITR